MGDLKDAVSSGDNRRALEAIRDQLAEKLDAGECKYCGGPRGEASGLAALTLRLMKVMEALDAIPTEEEVSAVDDLTARRSARRAPTAAHLVDPVYGGKYIGPGGS